MIENLTSPAWADADQMSIILHGTLDGEPSTFVARADDVEPRGQAIFQRAIAGEYGAIADYVAPDATPLRYINKMALISRLTDDEGDQLAAAMTQVPGKLSLLYAAATIIDRQDPLFPMLHDFIASVLGSDERADEILAGTE